MDFLSFCRAHGVLIDYLPPIGLWRRYPTEDKPRHRNGAVKWNGEIGWVQNHATMIEVAIWRTDTPVKYDAYAQVQKAAQETAERQRSAARKAAMILKQCTFTSHPYLTAKGFPEEAGNTYFHEGEHILVIPMRGPELCGVQLIKPDGDKKFLFGQRTGGAEFVWDNKGPHILCEGYATSLSIRHVLKSLKRRYTIHVCFSAGNMKKIAEKLPGGFIVADNDLSGTGERVAKEIGWPYFMSPEAGEDFNDLHRRVGNFRAGQELLTVFGAA